MADFTDLKISHSKLAFRDAFIKLARLKPFDEITTSDIIKNSGYSRGSFYLSFKDKFDFAQYIVNYEINRFAHIIYSTSCEKAGASQNNGPYENALKLFEYVFENKELYSLIINGKIPDYNFDNFSKSIVLILKEKTDLMIPPEIDKSIDPSYLKHIQTGIYLISIKFWENIDFKIPPRLMLEQLVSFYQLGKPAIIYPSK